MSLIQAIGSWRMTAALIVGLTGTYLSYSTGPEPFSRWMEFLLRTSPGQALYAAFILNLLGVSIREAYLRFRPVELNPREMETIVEVPSTGRDFIARVPQWIEKAGFRADFNGSMLRARKGRFSFLPGTLLRGGLVVLLSALLLGAHTRHVDEAVLYEGESRVLTGMKVTLTRIEPTLQAEPRETGGEGGFRLDEVSALVSTPSGPLRVTSGYPRGVEGRYFRVTGLGLSQPVSLSEGREGGLETGALEVLPPGRVDTIVLRRGEAALSIVLEPAGSTGAGVKYNLMSPIYRLSLKTGGEPPLEALARPGEGVSLGSTGVSLGRNSLYIRLRAAHDPGIMWSYAGIILAAAGLALMPFRVLWYERRLCVKISYNSVLMGYKSEFYRNRAEAGFRLLAGRMGREEHP